jgi:WD40 repeat protein
VAVSAKGDVLAAASDSGDIAVIDLASGGLSRTLRRGHSNIVSGLAFRPSRPSELVSVGLDTRCVCWELGNGGRLRRVPAPAALRCVSEL